MFDLDRCEARNRVGILLHQPDQQGSLCIDPAVFAQVRPLMQMLERAFSSSAPGGDADGYRS